MELFSWFQYGLFDYILPLISIGMSIMVSIYFYYIRSELTRLMEQHGQIIHRIDRFCDKLDRDAKDLVKRSDDIMTTTDLLHKHVHLAHQRVKDAYTGVFSRLNLNRIRRAYKNTDPVIMQQKQDERNAILNEVYNDMLTTEFT